jgi:hypothetical protein
MKNGIPYIGGRDPVLGYESFIMTGFDKERSYVPHYIGDGGLTTSSSTAGFYAIFFSPPFDVIIRKLYNPFTTNTGLHRFGIYTNQRNDILYPDRLIWDSGEFSATTIDIPNLSIPLRGGEGYWAAVTFDTSRNSNNVLRANVGAQAALLGDDGTFMASTLGALSALSLYALPPTAPSGLIPSGTDYTAIGLVFDIA